MELLITGPEDARHTLALAHGAGQPMDAPAMELLAAGLAQAGLRVVRFEFSYMARRRRAGGRGGGPDRQPVLEETWRAVITQVAAGMAGGAGSLAIGGRSMGGRIASLVADECGVGALVCFAYPFHPAGRPDKLRTAHLAELRTPTLILQGERDPFGNRAEVAGYRLSPAVTVHWIADGDHGFKPRKMSGRTLEQNTAEAVAQTAAFLSRLQRTAGGS